MTSRALGLANLFRWGPVRRLVILPLLISAACGRGPPLSTADELRRSAFEQGLELLDRSAMQMPHPVCVGIHPELRVGRLVAEDPSPALVRALRGAHPLMRKASDCTFTDDYEVKGAFGVPGVLMWVDSVSVRPGNLAVAQIGYVVGPMYGATFQCDFHLREREWRVTRCDRLSVS